MTAALKRILFWGGLVLALLFGGIPLCSAAVPCDGTNVWIGARLGGSWSDVRNWRAVSKDGFGVRELFARRAVYDFRTLDNGAVVSFDYADGNVVENALAGQMFISGLLFAGETGSVWTVLNNSAAKVHLTAQAELDIAGGRLDFHPLVDQGFTYPTMPFVKKGDGILRFCQPNAFFWETTHTLESGCLSLSNNYHLVNSDVSLKGDSCLAADYGSNCVANVSSVGTSQVPAVTIASGAVLDLSSGFNRGTTPFYGDVRGTGKLRVSGGSAFRLLKGAWRRPLSFRGEISVASADLSLGTIDQPVTLNPASSIQIECGGWLHLLTSQRLSGLFGPGVDGGVDWPDGKVLTVETSTDAAYAGRLQGGRFVKEGEGTLTLSGVVSTTTAVQVACGTLALDVDGSESIPSPLAWWDFDSGAEQAGSRVFLDRGASECHLVSLPASDGRHPELLRMPYPEDLGSKAVRLTSSGAHLRLQRKGALDSLLQKGGSFTFTMRSGRSSTRTFLILGDGTTAGSLRFSYESCPRVMSVYAGSTSRLDFGSSSIAYGDRGAAWFLHTVVYDAENRCLRLYEDGVLRKTYANRTLNLVPQDLVIGAATLSNGVVSDFCVNVTVDDLRLWNMALTDEQVRTLARTFRSGVQSRPSVLPQNLRPQVDEGACLRVARGRHELPSVQGMGRVEISSDAELALTDPSPLAGAVLTFDGPGVLALPEDLRIACDAVYRTSAPVWSHTGTVRLPSRGHVVFTRTAPAEPPDAGDYPLVAAKDFILPASWEAWTVEPTWTNRTVTFVVSDGKLFARVRAPDRVQVKGDGSLAVASLEGTLHPKVYASNWSANYNGVGTGTVNQDGGHLFTIAGGNGISFNGVFTCTPTGDRTLAASWTMTPDRDGTVSALAVSLELPIALFGGGWAEMDGTRVDFPVDRPDRPSLRSAKIQNLVLYGGDGQHRLTLAFRSPLQVLLQDNREWNGATYTVRISPPGSSSFIAGTSFTVACDLTLPDVYEYGSPPPFVIKNDLRWTPMPLFAPIKAGTALDFSTLRGTEAPAGCHGRVVRRGRHFEFENLPGVPQRFYGVNICQEANIPSGNEAVFAANLARMGYNAIRFHHHEASLVKGVNDVGATTLNPAMMDRFDRLVAACVTNGIYLTTDLYVSRTAMSWRSLGIDKSGSPALADFKAVVLVHEPAVSNLIVFTRNFLGHVNPYLGRSLAHEPALVGISLVNEGAISTTPYTLSTNYPCWKSAWETWLAAKKVTEPAVYSSVSTSIPTSWTPHFRRFVQERELAFATRMRAIVRDELGCQVPLTSLNGCTYPLGYMQVRASVYDYADDHFYVDHPSFPEKKWSLPSTLGNVNPLANKACGMQALVFRRLMDRPYTISEFNFSAPGRYRGVGGMATGAAGALQDWDGIWRFAWSHGEAGITRPETKALSYFDMAGDPLSLAAERAAICLFLRRDLPPLRKSLVARIPPELVSGPSESISVSVDCPWRWAGWFARLGHVVSNAVPEDLTSAGAYPAVRDLSDSQVRMALGYGNALPTGGDGALDIDSGTGAFRLDTARTAGGFSESGCIVAGPLSADISSTPTTVWVSSLDDRPVRSSRRLLLTHLTDVQNSGITYQDSSLTYLQSWGKLPHLMRAGRAEVRLALDPGRFFVYVLAPDGSRVRTVEAAYLPNEGLAFTADTAAAAEASWLYEIVRRPPIPVILLR